MIDAADIERAERILQITYREREAPRQLRQAEVEIESFNKWLQARLEVLDRSHPVHYRRTPPQVIQAYNTLLMHFFLVGLVCGRDEAKEIV